MLGRGITVVGLFRENYVRLTVMVNTQGEVDNRTLHWMNVTVCFLNRDQSIMVVNSPSGTLFSISCPYLDRGLNYCTLKCWGRQKFCKTCDFIN